MDKTNASCDAIDEPNTSTEQHDQNPQDRKNSNRHVSLQNQTLFILTSILYGLAVVSLGVTGLFLPANLVDTCNIEPKLMWTTMETNLPSNVRAWVQNENLELTLVEASHGYVESNGISLFGAKENDKASSHQEYLWTSTASSPPSIRKQYLEPSHFVTLSVDTVCFQTKQMKSQSTPLYSEPTMTYMLHCTDGETILSEQSSRLVPHENRMHSFLFSSGYLWFKEEPLGREAGVLIYSIDPSSMIVELHSRRVPNAANGESGCNSINTLRDQAKLALLTVALPMTIMSLVLWKTKHTPSMGVLLYASLSLVYTTIHVAAAPESVTDSNSPPFAWWFCISGMFTMLISTYFLLSKKLGEDATIAPIQLGDENEEAVRWLLGTSAVGYVYGATALIIFDATRDTVGFWILLNLVVFLPMFVFGAATEVNVLIVLGGLGLLADAVRIAALADGTLGVAITFCAAGLLSFGIGYLIRHSMVPVQTTGKATVAKINQWIFPSVVVANESQSDDLQSRDEGKDHITVSLENVN